MQALPVLPPPHPFYLDWVFWTAVIALLALILSQMPPLYELLRSPRLFVEPYARIVIGHKVGNPNIQLQVIVGNEGGRSVRIRGIRLKLWRDGVEIGEFPAQNYLGPDDKTTVLFTSFSLDAKKEWSHIVNFLNYFNRDNERRYRVAQDRLRRDISNKRAALTPEQQKTTVVEADPPHVEPFLQMFDELFVWQPGEYVMELTVMTDQSSERWTHQRYRFTLYESDSAALVAAKDDFKIGDGIYWNSSNHPSIIPPLTQA